MNATSVQKSRARNLLEGMTLSAICRTLPIFAGAVLLLKLAGVHVIAVERQAIFVALAWLRYAMTAPFLGHRFPRFFKYSYEPLFFDAKLSFSEKLSQWRAQLKASQQV